MLPTSHVCALIDARRPGIIRARPKCFFLVFCFLQGVFATACLPVLFTLCAMLASAWIDAAPPSETDRTVPDSGAPAAPEACLPSEPDGLQGEDQWAEGMAASACYAGGGDGGTCGRLRLEELAFVALCRAAWALWGLVLRVLRPEAGDGPGAAVSVISLCSVAFFAVPTFRALEDAERTYQVGGYA